MSKQMTPLKLKILEGAVAYAHRLPEGTDKKESVLFFLNRIGQSARQDQRWTISIMAKDLIAEIHRVGSVNLVRKRLIDSNREPIPSAITPASNTGVTPPGFAALEEYV